MSPAPSRLWVGRPDATAGPWVDCCEHEGVAAEILELVSTEALPVSPELQEALSAGARWDWLFLTSARGVARWVDVAGAAAWTAVDQVAVVGPATAEAVRSAGGSPDLVGDAGGAELARLFLERWESPVAAASGSSAGVAAPRLLFVGACDARPELRESLQASGLRLTEWAGYRTIPVPGIAPDPGEPVLLFSPSGAAALLERVDEVALHPVWAVGETTAHAAREIGFPVEQILDRPRPESLTDLLRR